MPRTWASGDNVFLPIGNLVGIGSSANTLVAIAKKASDSAWMTPTAIQPSAGNPTVSMQVSSTNKLSYVSGATDKDTGITWQASDGWVFIAVDKDAGTATPNGHMYVYSTNTWTHSAAGSTVGGNSTDLTGGKVQHGRWATGDPFIGDIALAGNFKRQLSQTQLEYLPFSLQALLAAAPDYLVLFDQAATSMNVIDLITGNTEQSHSGASVSSNSVPVFSYGFSEAIVVGHAGGGTDATVTPSTVAAVASVPSATVSTGSTVTPATVAAVAAVPTATVATGSTVIAATVAAVAAVPTATVATGSTVTAAVVAAVAAVPSASVSAGSTVLAATVLAVAAVPAATVATGSAVIASTVAAVAAVPTPSVSAGGATISAVTVAAVAAVPSSTLATGSTVLPTTIAAVASVPTATVVVPAAGLAGEAHGPESLPTGAITSRSTALAGGVT